MYQKKTIKSVVGILKVTVVSIRLWFSELQNQNGICIVNVCAFFSLRFYDEAPCNVLMYTQHSFRQKEEVKSILIKDEVADSFNRFRASELLTLCCKVGEAMRKKTVFSVVVANRTNWLFAESWDGGGRDFKVRVGMPWQLRWSALFKFYNKVGFAIRLVSIKKEMRGVSPSGLSDKSLCFKLLSLM